MKRRIPQSIFIVLPCICYSSYTGDKNEDANNTSDVSMTSTNLNFSTSKHSDLASEFLFVNSHKSKWIMTKKI